VPQRHTPIGEPASGATEVARVEGGLEVATKLDVAQKVPTPAEVVDLLKAAEESFRPITESVDALEAAGDASPEDLEKARLADEKETEAAYARLLAAATRVKTLAAVAKTRNLTSDEKLTLASIYARVGGDIGMESGQAAAVEASAAAVEASAAAEARKAAAASESLLADADEARRLGEEADLGSARLMDVLNDPRWNRVMGKLIDDAEEFKNEREVILEELRQLSIEKADLEDRYTGALTVPGRRDKPSGELSRLDKRVARYANALKTVDRRIDGKRRDFERVNQNLQHRTEEMRLLGEKAVDMEARAGQSAADSDRLARESSRLEVAAEEAATYRPMASAFTTKWTPYRSRDRSRGRSRGRSDRDDLGELLAERVYKRMSGDVADVARIAQRGLARVEDVLLGKERAEQPRTPSGRFGKKDRVAVEALKRSQDEPEAYSTSEPSAGFMRRLESEGKGDETERYLTSLSLGQP
jgi:hypothetical protein